MTSRIVHGNRRPGSAPTGPRLRTARRRAWRSAGGFVSHLAGWIVALAIGGVLHAPAWSAPAVAPLMDIPLLESLPGSINPPADPDADTADFARFVQRSMAETNRSARTAKPSVGSDDARFAAPYATPYTAPEASPRTTRQVFFPTRAPEMIDRPMAPLPPAVVAGPIGIALASFIAWRAKRHGGRI